MPEKIYPAACLCGAVSIEAAGEPDFIAACHCVACRRHTGAPVAVYLDYKRDRIAFTGEQPQAYASSPGATRGFCGTCGATVYYQGDNHPDMIHLHIGLFEDAAHFQPKANENTGTQLPWIHVQVSE